MAELPWLADHTEFLARRPQAERRMMTGRRPPASPKPMSCWSGSPALQDADVR